MAYPNLLTVNPVLYRNRERRAVFYGRVSTQHEAQLAALENQMQWYDDQIKYHPNWLIVERYIDEGITGTLAKKRPSFMRMIEDAKNGRFDLIVTREVCRFARNTVDTLVMTRELKEYGVEVYFVEDNIWTMDGDGELRLTIMATLAQEESRKISERVRAGQAISRENGGLYGTGNIIGYDRVGDTYFVNEEQAVTIRKIFELYSNGFGEKRICSELTRLGYKDGYGRISWSCTKISRILRNATYKGYIGYNKSTTNNFLDKKRIKNLDEDSYILVKGNFEPLVSEELWNRCRQIRSSKTGENIWKTGIRRSGKKAPADLWLKKLKCRCGCTFRRENWRKSDFTGEIMYGYACYSRKTYGSLSAMKECPDPAHFCDMISFPAWKMSLMAKEIFRRVWGDQRESVLLACKMLSQCNSLPDIRNAQRISSLEAQLQKLHTRLKNYSIMRADGELSKEEFLQLTRDVNREIIQLDAELQNEKNFHPSSGSLSVESLQAALNRMIDTSKANISESLIEEFVETVVPVENYRYRWKLSFENLEPGFHSDLLSPSNSPVMSFTIDFDTAKEYRQACQMATQFRKSQWHDIEVEVYF